MSVYLHLFRVPTFRDVIARDREVVLEGTLESSVNIGDPSAARDCGDWALKADIDAAAGGNSGDRAAVSANEGIGLIRRESPRLASGYEAHPAARGRTPGRRSR